MPISPSAVTVLPAPADYLRYLPHYIEQIDAELAEPWSAAEEHRRIVVNFGPRNLDAEFRGWPFDIESEALVAAYTKEGWALWAADRDPSKLMFRRPALVHPGPDHQEYRGIGAVEVAPGDTKHISQPMTSFCRAMSWPVLHAPDGALLRVLGVSVGGMPLQGLDIPDGGLPVEDFSAQRRAPHVPQPFVRKGEGLGVVVHNTGTEPVMVSAAFIVDSLGQGISSIHDPAADPVDGNPAI